MEIQQPLALQQTLSMTPDDLEDSGLFYQHRVIDALNNSQPLQHLDIYAYATYPGKLNGILLVYVDM